MLLIGSTDQSVCWKRWRSSIHATDHHHLCVTFHEQDSRTALYSGQVVSPLAVVRSRWVVLNERNNLGGLVLFDRTTPVGRHAGGLARSQLLVLRLGGPASPHRRLLGVALAGRPQLQALHLTGVEEEEHKRVGGRVGDGGGPEDGHHLTADQGVVPERHDRLQDVDGQVADDEREDNDHGHLQGFRLRLGQRVRRRALQMDFPRFRRRRLPAASGGFPLFGFSGDL